MRHLYSVLGDRRENAVPCSTCSTMIWNICGRCDRHCRCNRAPRPMVAHCGVCGQDGPSRRQNGGCQTCTGSQW